MERTSNGESAEYNIGSDMDMVTELLVACIEEAFRRRSWHGTNLRGSVRGLTPAQASWRPGPGRHNIWELVVHAAYWKYVIRRKLTGEARGSFPLEGSDFWEREAGSEKEWKQDVALLTSQHERLIEAVHGFPASRWASRAVGSPFTNAGLARGAAAHDLYHAGQIQLLKRIRGGRRGQRDKTA